MSMKPREVLMMTESLIDELAEMKTAEAGLYVHLLMLCCRDGFLPSDLEDLGKAIGNDRRGFRRAWPAVSRFFVVENDRLESLYLRSLPAREAIQ